MNKRELIDCICEINRSAKPEFLANFSEEELNTYLEHLMELDVEQLAVSCEVWMAGRNPLTAAKLGTARSEFVRWVANGSPEWTQDEPVEQAW